MLLLWRLTVGAGLDEGVDEFPVGCLESCVDGWSGDERGDGEEDGCKTSESGKPSVNPHMRLDGGGIERG